VRLRALVVDDEAPAREELRFLLSRHPEVEVVGEAASAVEALKLAAGVRYDVLFLDIQMPQLTGLQVARLIRDRLEAPELVFVTAHAEHAIEAFSVEAFDYLLKPVDPARLARVVQRLLERRVEADPSLGKLAVVSGGSTTLLDLDTVHFAEADGDYSRVHTFDRAYLCTSSLRELEASLPGSRFVRIHRSHLVNVAKVARVGRAAPDRLKLTMDDEARTELEVARRQTHAVRERLRL
jgi:DNA-binding LytR/AlgR family response regulator